MKNFRHQKLDLPDMNTETINGSRYYLTPNGKKYPSITTVLGKLSKDGLVDWQRRVGATEAKKILEYAGNFGTSVHSSCEKYLKNDSTYLDDASPHSKLIFPVLQEQLDRIDNIQSQEVALLSHKLKVAGRVDCIADFDGVPSIIDFKTSRKHKLESWIENYFVQATAYSIMYEEMTGIKIQDLVIAMITYDGVPLIFKKKRKDYFKRLGEILTEVLPQLQL